MTYVKRAFDRAVEWDKRMIRKFQKRLNLSDYQVLCLSFAKGLIIGAILL